MTKYLIGAVLLVGSAYGIIEAWPLISGPRISLASPAESAVVQDGIVEVRGRAPRAASLTLNGTPILYDQNGAFSSILTFPRGGSILTLVATDRFGRSVQAERTIFVP